MRFTFTGECRHPEQQIHSCQNVGSQFLIANQKFNITYKACQGMDWTANKGINNLSVFFHEHTYLLLMICTYMYTEMILYP